MRNKQKSEILLFFERIHCTPSFHKPLYNKLWEAYCTFVNLLFYLVEGFLQGCGYCRAGGVF